MKTVIICYEKKAQEFLLLLNHLLIESSKIVSAQLQTEILDSLDGIQHLEMQCRDW